MNLCGEGDLIKVFMRFYLGARTDNTNGILINQRVRNFVYFAGVLVSFNPKLNYKMNLPRMISLVVVEYKGSDG